MIRIEEQDRTFYHATFGCFLDSIKKYGLGAKQNKVWDISETGYTYFVNDPEVALSFCETAEFAPEEVYDSGFVVLSIRERDIGSYVVDKNVANSPDLLNSEGQPLVYIMTKNVIPYSKFTGVKEYD